MAEAIQVTGPALVKIDYGSGLSNLGYSINGIEIFPEVFMSDVPGDQNGGDEGPPIDVQYFGETARVRMELSKWDTTVAGKILARVKNGTAGAIATAGSLMFTGALYYRVLILPTTQPMNFVGAIARAPIELNKGTKYSRLLVEFECHGIDGVLWNTTTT